MAHFLVCTLLWIGLLMADFLYLCTPVGVDLFGAGGPAFGFEIPFEPLVICNLMIIAALMQISDHIKIK